MGLREDIMISLECGECGAVLLVGLEDAELLLKDAKEKKWKHTSYGPIYPNCIHKFKEHEIEPEE